MKMKKAIKKISCMFLAILMIFSTLQIVNIKDVSAVSLYPESTLTVTRGLQVNLGNTALNENHAYIYNMTMGGATGFCLDVGKTATSGTKYARKSSKTNSTYNRIYNYALNDETINHYLESTPGTWSNNNRAAAQALIWSHEEGLSVKQSGVVLYNVIKAIWDGISAAPDWILEEWAQEAFNYSDASGTLYIYDSGIGSRQRIITKTSGQLVEPNYREVSSTKSYSKSESIKARVNKSDVDTSQKLSGVTFDFYKDGTKGGSATTNTDGIAEYTFNTEFSKSATSTKTYCSNYSDLSIPNQALVTGYTSKASAQAAADAEALAKAKELAEAGSGEEHTYKIVETSTKTNYWLNPATATYEKKHTGEGTVEFNIGNKRQVGSITITKRDSETNNLVDNAIYGLYARSNIVHPDGVTGVLYTKDQLVASFPKTGTNGTAILNNLYLGQYYIKEITAPSGYLHSSDVYNVDLNYAGQNVQVTDASTTVKDKVQRASVNLIKQDKELNNGSKDSDIFDFNKDGSQADATRVGATYGLYAREDIVHADGASGVVIYNQIKDSIHELKATKGTDLSVKNVRATAGTLLATIKTDNNGEFGFEHLYNGKYFIKEIEASTGYILDTTEYDFNLSYTNQSETVVTKNGTVLEQVAKQAFSLFKAGHVPGTSTNAKPLAGVEFTVWLESDIQTLVKQGKTLEEAKQLAGVYDKLTTKEDGTASSIELPYGKYRVSETKAKDDYYTAEDFFVTVTEDSRTHQSFTNNVIIDELFMGLIEAIKLDKETGKQVKLEGTEFKIKNTDTNEYFGYWEWLPFPKYVDSWKTNSDGFVRLQKELQAGNYQLEEIHAPEGYLLDTEPVTFKISNKDMYEIAEDGKTPLIKAYKSDVYVKGQITVEKRGEVLTAFENNQFIYEERGLPNAEYNVIAKEDILDPSNDGTVLFETGEVVDTITTDENGKGTSKKLPLGIYEIAEKKAPHGMTINTEKKTVELKYADELTEVVFENSTFVNERQKVNAKVIKVDEEFDTVGLSGAEFDFIVKEDIRNYDNQVIVKANTVLNKYISSITGEININEMDLPLNYNFELVETKAPIGYVLDSTAVEFNTDYQGQEIETVIIEKTKTNKATEVDFSKIDLTTDKELPGNYMTVFEKDNEGSIFETWISGDKPHTVKNLDTDVRYILRETSSVKGFYIANDIEFEIDQQGKVYIYDKDDEKVVAKDNLIVMGNDLVKGRLEWNKQGEIFTHTDTGQNEFGKVETPIWEQSNLLQTEITIYAAEDITLGNNVTYYKADEKVQTLESDWDAVQSKDLLVGRYYYVESKTPHGYIVNTDKHYFEVKDNQSSELQIIKSTLANDRPTVEIEFTKFMETFKHHNKLDNAYKDVLFGIYAREDIYGYKGNVAIENGTLVATSGIDELGQLDHTPDLPNGVYYLKELATNEDYVLDTKEYDFEVAYHGQDVSRYVIQIGENGSIENKLIRGSIEIKKNDSFDDTKKLSDVGFNISATEDMSDIISTSKTDENGTVRFEDMEIGKYYIQEAKQLNGYVLNDHIYEVEITTNGEVLTIDVDNKPTEMVFSKVDETGVKELPGAEIEIIDKETGVVIEKWTSTEESHVIHYLVEGKEYLMRETTAPYGYEIAEEITFIAKDGQKVTMKDELILTDIQVNKVDSQTMKPIKSLDFEFTMYSDEACTKPIKVVNANKEEGTATFKDVPYSTVYIKETNAPTGYKLSDEIKKIIIDENMQQAGDMYSFTYLNTLMPTTVIQTNDYTDLGIYSIFGLIGLAGAITILRRKKKED